MDYISAQKFVQKLSTTKLDGGLTLRELTDHEGISLWWFAHFDFIDLLLHMPAGHGKYNPLELRLQAMIGMLPAGLFAGFNFVYDVFRKLIIHALLFFYRSRNGGAAPDRKKIMFTAADNRWRWLSESDSGRRRLTDTFFDPLVRILKKDYHLIGTYPCVKYIYPFQIAFESLKVLISKVKSWEIEHLPFEIFWTPKVWLMEYRACVRFAARWANVANDTTFRELCILNGIDYYDIIRIQMKFYFKVLFATAIKRIALSNRMLKITCPDLVALINEYGIFERALLIAAKQNGIPTFAIQHGNIHAAHPGYMYSKKEISIDGSVRSPFCPIPDKTAVYGKYYQQLLTEQSAYPQNSLIVTGQPRYDVLAGLKTKRSKEQVLEEINIASDKKVVLWTTQCIGMTESENIVNAQALSEAFRKLNDFVLVIKQHPRDRLEHLLILRDHLDLPQENILVAPINAETLKLIHACDLMITKFSTTAIEAIALEKPLIIMNLTNEPDKVDFVKKGIAVGVYQPELLAQTIENIFGNNTEMENKREVYIKDYLYLIDGKASHRVAKAMTEIIEGAQ